MRQLAGRLGPYLERLVSAFWAGLLWAFAAIPLVTLIASTTALTSVVTERRRENESPTFRIFKDSLIAHWRRTLPAGVLWLAAAVVLWADVYFGLNARTAMPIRVAAAAIGALGAIVAVGAALFLVEQIVSRPAPLRVQLRNALLLTLANIGTTLLCTLLLAAAVLGSYLLAPLLPFFGYLCTWLHHRLVSRAVTRTVAKAEALRGERAPEAGDAALVQ